MAPYMLTTEILKLGTRKMLHLFTPSPKTRGETRLKIFQNVTKIPLRNTRNFPRGGVRQRLLQRSADPSGLQISRVGVDLPLLLPRHFDVGGFGRRVLVVPRQFCVAAFFETFLG